MTIADCINFETLILKISSQFYRDMVGLIVTDPEIFEGRSTFEEWGAQVECAREDLEAEMASAIERVEMKLHDGQYHVRSEFSACSEELY